MEEVRVYCDGSGWNNIDSSYCVIIPEWIKVIVHDKVVRKKDKKIVQVFEEEYDVYEIEFRAMIAALELCEELSEKKRVFTVYSDSKVVVNEINFRKKAKNKNLLKKAREIIQRNKKIKIRWVSREENPAGKYLETRLKKLKSYGRNSSSMKRKKN